MKMQQYAPEQYLVRFIGFLRTEANTTLKIFSTVSPDFANLVIERAKANRLGSIDWVAGEFEPEDE
jgi:hypothetical protein